ncbi:hypothetical protein PZB75_14225 [Streptomyces sp. AM 4-1-1]|uniref:hypothetical protein n=1 Tax=unclassified Streptomyces TaxID=2593676 RepID=UPI0023B9670B|nr:hypothetical protein [Streptomyces sp. AM 4-1-1]WEH34405.1 hypothetical protein PZB75_14225 [Streptomyces sp. AM 4-1-1]
MTHLTVGAAAAVRAPRGEAPADDTAALEYFRDLLGPFGIKPDEELLGRGPHVSHRQLADLLAEADGVRESRPHLLVVAHALPDVVPFTAISPHLTERLGGEAVNFAVGQQGLAAPFTALRIAAAYHRAGRAAEVVIAVLEQTTLPTRFPLVHDTPLTDSAAALVLRSGEGQGLNLARVATVPSLADACAREDGTRRTLFVFGPWAGEVPVPEGADAHRAPPGTYCTGVWLELAENWQRWQRTYRKVVLCDTDPRDGRGHLAVFTAAGDRDE